MFYSVIETRNFSLFNQSAQALLKGYFIMYDMVMVWYHWYAWYSEVWFGLVYGMVWCGMI